MILSAIIPIGNYKDNESNILNIISLCESLSVELIFVLDDPSINYSHDLQLPYQSKLQNNIKIINSKSGNPGGARNLGLLEATGEWITFWDCDDLPIPKNILETVLKNKKSKYSVIVGGFKMNDLQSPSMNLEFPIIAKNDFEFISSLARKPGIWRFIFRNELVSKYSFYNLRMAEDQLFLAKIMSTNPKILISDQYFYNYITGNTKQLTRNKFVMDDLLIALKINLETMLSDESHNNLFSRIVFFKNLISGLIHARIYTKFRIIFFLFRSFFMIAQLGFINNLKSIWECRLP